MTNRTRESAVLRALRLDLPRRLPGLILWRNAAGYDERACQRYGLTRGASDLIGIYRGRFVALEVKRPHGGRLSEPQELFLRIIRDAGGIAACVRSVDEAEEAIRRAAP